MKRLLAILFCIQLINLFSCKPEMEEREIRQIGVTFCRKPAKFVSKQGFNPNKSAFSTSDAIYKGLVLVSMPNFNGDTSIKKWQHPSWSKFGWLGPITTDKDGNVYAAPIPKINTLDHKTSEINKVLKVSTETAELTLLTQLPVPDSSSQVVAYGVLGVYYDCHGDKLYVSSVSGSTRDKENGALYVLDIKDGKILDKIEGIDAMGLCVGGITGEKKLYFGSARNSYVNSILLDKAGYFKGKVQPEFTLDLLGPRGDDKARRIRFDQNGNMNIQGIEFNYSLSAQSEKPETNYLFSYNSSKKIWENKKVN